MNSSDVSAGAGLIAQKLRLVLGALQTLALAYLLWVLWEILRPLRDPASILGWMGHLEKRPLSEVLAWQWGAYVAIDALNWVLMALAVGYCWRAVNQIKRTDGRHGLASRLLVTGAWVALAAEAMTLAVRPLKSYVLTCCDGGAAPLLHWFFYPNDMLVIMLCLTLLALAHVFSWKVYLAEENKGFV